MTKEVLVPNENLQGPVIVLPEEKREPLTKKLEEYRARLDRSGVDSGYTHPDFLLLLQPDTMYKITVLERLLDKGSVATYELSQELAERIGQDLNVSTFNNACGVIEDYCKTGGENIRHGTGLPQSSK